MDVRDVGAEEDGDVRFVICRNLQFPLVLEHRDGHHRLVGDVAFE